MPSEQPTDAEMRPVDQPEYDSTAAARDMMTRQLVLAAIHGGFSDPTESTVDECRDLARYIQETNEEIDY